MAPSLALHSKREIPMLRNSISGLEIEVFSGWTSGFRVGFRPDSSRESLNIGHPAGRRPAGEPNLMFSRLEFGRNPARKLDFRPGGTIAGL